MQSLDSVLLTLNSIFYFTDLGFIRSSWVSSHSSQMILICSNFRCSLRRGFLDKKGFFVALKLVALAQAGHDINIRNIFLETPNPPKVVNCEFCFQVFVYYTLCVFVVVTFKRMLVRRVQRIVNFECGNNAVFGRIDFCGTISFSSTRFIVDLFDNLIRGRSTKRSFCSVSFPPVDHIRSQNLQLFRTQPRG